MVLPIAVPNLGLSSSTSATSGSSGAVISGGQSNGPPWWVWFGAGVLALLFLLKD